ncbi:hypothetical protein GCM10027280_56830 [Micromonospora polyrhachis]
MFSNATSRPTPITPIESITPATQPVSPPISVGSTSAATAIGGYLLYASMPLVWSGPSYPLTTLVTLRTVAVQVCPTAGSEKSLRYG